MAEYNVKSSQKERLPSDSFNNALAARALRIAQWVGSPISLVLHTVIFTGSFTLLFFDTPLDSILLALTTVVSLEAIYLAIFIQMSVNAQSRELEEVSEDLEDIQDNVENLQEDVEDIQEDVRDITDDVDAIARDVDEIGEDIAEDERSDTENTHALHQKLSELEKSVALLLEDIKTLRKEEEAPPKP